MQKKNYFIFISLCYLNDKKILKKASCTETFASFVKGFQRK